MVRLQSKEQDLKVPLQVSWEIDCHSNVDIVFATNYQSIKIDLDFSKEKV